MRAAILGSAGRSWSAFVRAHAVRARVGRPPCAERMWAPAATGATSTRCSSEAEAFWTAFLRKLTQRGLRGVKLVVSDAHEHFARNALACVGRNGRRVVAAFATAFAQNDEEAAKGQWRNSLAVSRCWRVTGKTLAAELALLLAALLLLAQDARRRAALVTRATCLARLGGLATL